MTSRIRTIAACHEAAASDARHQWNEFERRMAAWKQAEAELAELQINSLREVREAIEGIGK